MASPVVTVDRVITQGKTRELINISNSSAAGTRNIIFVSEAESVKLSLNIAEPFSGAFSWKVIEISGDSTKHEVEVYSSGNLTSSGVYQQIIPATGKIRIEVVYPLATTFEISGTGVASYIPIAPPASTIERTADQQNDVVAIHARMEQMLELLQKILNHQRIITGVEADKGEDY